MSRNIKDEIERELNRRYLGTISEFQIRAFPPDHFDKLGGPLFEPTCKVCGIPVKAFGTMKQVGVAFRNEIETILALEAPWALRYSIKDQYELNMGYYDDLGGSQ